jgi:hypothetical protein
MSAQTYRPAVPIHRQHDVITALSFDPTSDTLWSGSNSGNVTAYYTPQGMRGVSFPVGGGMTVNKVVADEIQVRAQGVAGEGVGAWSKGGVNRWYYRYAVCSPCSDREGVNNTSQPIRIRHDLLRNAELLKDGRGVNYNSRDRTAKLHDRERDKTSSHTVRHPATSLYPFLPSLR